jgi:SAM-dependent methyltransferase
VTFYDAYAEHYDAHYRRRVDFAENEALARLLPQGGAVLDLGCGTGLGYELTSPRTYVGIDESQAMLDHAFKGEGIRLICGDVDNPAIWPVGPFDAVISLFAYPYFGRPVSVCAYAKASLRTGGRLIVMGFTRRYQRRRHRIAPPTERADTPEAVALQMRMAGLDVVDQVGFRYLPDALCPLASPARILRAGRTLPASWALAHLTTGVKR